MAELIKESKFKIETSALAGLYDDCRAGVDLDVFSLGNRLDFFNAAQFVEPDAANDRDGNYRRRDADGDHRRAD